MLATGSRTWGIVLTRGILSLLLGIGILAWPRATVLVIVVLFAVFCFLDGIATVIQGFAARKEGGSIWWIVLGVLTILAGVVALVWPGVTALALLYVIAFWSIVVGVGAVAGAFRMRSAEIPHWGWLLAAGILSVAFGIVLVVSPVSGILALLWLMAVWAIAVGLMQIIGSFWVRKLEKTIEAASPGPAPAA